MFHNFIDDGAPADKDMADDRLPPSSAAGLVQRTDGALLSRVPQYPRRRLLDTEAPFDRFQKPLMYNAFSPVL
ncbi:hypothetical protein HMPREF0262_02161 [Clostridium sp. ATCC 29733]|nr:hypothetical protein HMPREF0262_02161 [Clostridium sp. ATCC 29733]